jgi:hypothetical protein
MEISYYDHYDYLDKIPSPTLLGYIDGIAIYEGDFSPLPYTIDCTADYDDIPF